MTIDKAKLLDALRAELETFLEWKAVEADFCRHYIERIERGDFDAKEGAK